MTAFPTLEVDLPALQANYRLLAKKHPCGAVVKANAYGLGVARVAPALYQAGCGEFFVATLDEAIRLRSTLPEAVIYVFHGCRKGQAGEFSANTLIPVLNDPAQIDYWNKAGSYALHSDTGMCRLGMDKEQIIKRAGDNTSGLCLLLSHLACADEPENLKNQEQLALFAELSAYFPHVRKSFVNSAGIFLGSRYYYDLLRPGCALYGIAPAPYLSGKMQNVATLSAPVLQYRYLTKAETVGYGATALMPAGSVLATVELGYADGLLRALSGKITGFAAGIVVPIVGRISMDMVSVDVTHLPDILRDAELRISFMNNMQTVDMLAKAADTIGYEVLTKLGERVRRVYRE